MQQMYRSVVALSALALLSACADSPVAPNELSPEGRGSQTGGASLSAIATATSFYERRQEYDWTLDKNVRDILDARMLPEASITETLIRPGEVKWVHYEFIANRRLAATDTLMGARGQVCVTNSGDATTENFVITAVIEQKTAGGWAEVKRERVLVAADPALEAEASSCYPYEVRFDGAPGAEYRVSAQVTATNHAGHRGSAFGPSAFAGFVIPRTMVATTKDAIATIHDDIVMMCSKIFPSLICTGSEGFQPTPLSQTLRYTHKATIDIYNFRVCGEDLKVTNYARIVEGGPFVPGEQAEFDEDSATFTVKTGDCPPQPANPGCTLTQGYWKNHAWPAHPMWGTLNDWPDINDWKFFDTTIEWHDILNVPPRGDAYLILAHQYVAAILNQQNGTYVPEGVRQTLVAAYDYFSLPKAQRDAVAREQIIAWADLLDRYNNGLLGVPHCR